MAQLQVPTADMSALDRIMYYMNTRGATRREGINPRRDSFTTSPGQSLDKRLREERFPIPNAPHKGKVTQPTSLFGDMPPEPGLIDKAKEFLAEALLDPNNIGTVGLVKMPEARRIIEEVTSKFRTKPSWAETRLTQYPPGSQHIQRTEDGAVSEMWKPPTIHSIPYPGAFSESDLAGTLGKYQPNAEGHHGFYTPKGERVNLGGGFTHRAGLDELTGYWSPEAMQDGKYVNDMFYDNPINKAHTYDIPEMISDTGLVRANKFNPRAQQQSYLDMPPNTTDAQIQSMGENFGKPRYSTVTLSPPDEIMFKLREQDPQMYKRLATSNLDSDRRATHKIFEDLISNYAEGLAKYLK